LDSKGQWRNFISLHAWGAITTTEQTANAGQIMRDKMTGAWTNVDAMIADAQRMAFPIKYFLFMT